MGLKDITRQAVLAAIAEYDRVDQPAFLSRYGFDPARLYLLVHDGKPYDSKAIVGAAHGFLLGEKPLTASQFSGGESDCWPSPARPWLHRAGRRRTDG